MSVARKSHLGHPVIDAELEELIANLGTRALTEDELKRQRASFVFGNAPEKLKVTRESARHAAESVLM